MRKYGKCLMLLILFVLYPKTVNASCSNEEMTKWKSLAQNVTISYDAVEKNGKVSFTITFSNMNKDLEIYDSSSQKMLTSTKNEFTITKNKDNQTYRFDIYTKHEYCGRVSLYTIYADIPAYNQYHNDMICDGVEEYALCKKWALIKYSYSEWKEKVQAYKDSLIPTEEETPIEAQKESLLEKIIDIYSDVYYIVLPIIIVVGMVTIYVYNKKRELF